MPTLPFVLPASLGLAAGLPGLYTQSGIKYNYAIGGLPFLSAASREHPILRETAPIRKQQFDAQSTPGEQSLDGWWLRSQQSFHGGAGQTFADPTPDNQYSAIRYRSSRNVSVWDQGRVHLLNDLTTVSPTVAGVTDMTEFNYGDGTGAAFGTAGSNYVLIRSGATTVVSFSTVDLNPLQSVTTDGSNIFVSNIAGVWSAPIPASAPGTFTWTKQYNIATNTKPTFMAFAKQRIMLAVGPAIYELNPYPATPPAALPTAKYTASDANWVWSGITESSAAIYVVGHNAVRGSILKFVLTNTGDVPTLTGGAIAAQLPSGEVAYSAIGYLGSFIGLGTNKGVRIGTCDDLGNITYGPTLFETDGAVMAWTARGRFLWCTVSRGNDGHSGLYRIDLSLQVADLRFPYATDLVAAGDASNCMAVANLGSSDRITFATANNLYTENALALASSGYLQTSRIRFNTLEPKLFKLIRVRGPVLIGPLAIVVLDANDGQAATHTLPEGVAPGAGDIAIAAPTDPSDFVSVKFVLTRDNVVPTAGGEMWAYQVKALPGGPRQRFIQLPLLCFDWEQDANGQRVGGAGSAAARLEALEDLEASGNSAALQDFATGRDRQCVIERLSFQQTAPPSGCGGWGGIATVTLRTI